MRSQDVRPCRTSMATRRRAAVQDKEEEKEEEEKEEEEKPVLSVPSKTTEVSTEVEGARDPVNQPIFDPLAHALPATGKSGKTYPGELVHRVLVYHY